MSRSLFISGGGGYIGQATIKQALNCDLKTGTLVHDSSSAAKLGRPAIKCIIGDIRNMPVWRKAVAQTDYVIDLLQPELPARPTIRAIRDISDYRPAVSVAISVPPGDLAQTLREPAYLSNTVHTTFAHI